ncbi:hypothetical protein PtA15_12A297 [Puccinia triticina]|uniref:Tryptophan synthase beta chain-like PALP domain-containing protein n=1 Tax=Puccinia triticina TaxID=208348 RepID=A0ABY7CYC5_9BASI|nr:uncharacterized protein PtA15_12A297 [Puccinia triticina]WAQ90308.1 hypothetical protein PtA15_12A297 [Puccinia triticina]
MTDPGSSHTVLESRRVDQGPDRSPNCAGGRDGRVECAGHDAPLSEIALPDDTAVEKAQLIENMGATVVKVRPVSISNRAHYVNVARDRARQFAAQQGEGGGARGLFADQFESPMNWRTHYRTTGPEIWAQTAGRVVAGAGTGGTMAGVGKFLKTRDERVQLVVKHGVLFSDTEVEGKRRRHQVDTVVEGIGSNWMTGNLEEIMDVVDDAIKVTDAEAISMSRKILEQEGLFLGSSSEVNLVASHKLALALNADREATGAETPGWICDSGHRHLSKFWNDPFLARHGFLDSPPSLS